MADNELKVIVKAKELAVHSFRLTSNCNRYPKKYRHSLVDRIQLKSLDLYETLLEANRINNVTRSWWRKENCSRRSFRHPTAHGRTISPMGIAMGLGRGWMRGYEK